MSRYIDVTNLSKQIADFKRVVTSPNSDYMTGYLCALSVTEGIIAGMPTAEDAHSSHGEWKDDNRLTHSSKFRCSVCDGLAYFVQPTRDKGWKRCCPYKYCPNCGAKMDGERREE